MTLEEIKAVVAEIRYRVWTFELRHIVPATASSLVGGTIYLQVRFPADGENWTGRKWVISPHATKSEIVQTALKAVLTAEEHEAREHFKYRGRAIFGPHYDVDFLAGYCDLPVAQDARHAPEVSRA